MLEEEIIPQIYITGIDLVPSNILNNPGGTTTVSGLDTWPVLRENQDACNSTDRG